MLYTLVESAKAGGVEPRAHQQYLFETLPTVTTPDGIETLFPHMPTPELLKIPAPALCAVKPGLPGRLRTSRYSRASSSVTEVVMNSSSRFATSYVTISHFSRNGSCLNNATIFHFSMTG
jgi:hypothetical protein